MSLVNSSFGQINVPSVYIIWSESNSVIILFKMSDFVSLHSSHSQQPCWFDIICWQGRNRYPKSGNLMLRKCSCWLLPVVEVGITSCNFALNPARWIFRQILSTADLITLTSPSGAPAFWSCEINKHFSMSFCYSLTGSSWQLSWQQQKVCNTSVFLSPSLSLSMYEFELKTWQAETFERWRTIYCMPCLIL